MKVCAAATPTSYLTRRSASKLPSINLIFFCCCFSMNCIADLVKDDVVIKTPLLICSMAPIKACKSCRVTLLPLAKRLAWIYIKSKPSLSSLIIPSIPPSCGFPVTIPEFLSYPYPIFKSKSTTRCSKNSGELFRTESNTCCRIFCKCSCSAALIFSSGNSSEISVVLGAVIIVAVFSVEIKRNLIFFPS